MYRIFLFALMPLIVAEKIFHDEEPPLATRGFFSIRNRRSTRLVESKDPRALQSDRRGSNCEVLLRARS